MIITSMSDLEKEMKAFHSLSGFRIAVFGLDEKEIIAYPPKLCEFCEMIRKNAEALSLCLECDHQAFATTKRVQSINMYTCPFSLYEAVTPLFINNSIHVGYLMIGQMAHDTWQALAHIKDLSDRYFLDKHLLEHKIKEIPSMSLDKILASVSIMRICAEYFIFQNQINTNAMGFSVITKEYIDNNFTSDITIEKLCELTHYSRSSMISAFKNEYQMSIGSYIRKKRTNLACNLLLNTDLSLREIAETCGFSEQNYFTKVFEKEKNCTPSQFRKKP